MLNLAADAVTPAELAESTGFSTNTLASWRSRGKGPKFVRIAGRIRYFKSDVQDWLLTEMNAAA